VPSTAGDTLPILRINRLSVVASVGFVLAFSSPAHVAPCGTQTSHFALVQAFAHGTARIDAYEGITCDKSFFEGHYYSVKAPGLAAASLPAYLALDWTGVLPDDMRWAIWLLSLSTLVPAALVLVVLVGRTAETIAPGWGRFTAVALGAGTLVLPFGSLWFGHVPAAMLGFAAYVVVRNRGVGRDEPSLRRTVAAGVLAGGGFLFEYPLAIVAVLLIAYVATIHGARGASLFAAGTAIPVTALLLYNRWAFGSILHFSYRYALPLRTDASGRTVGENDVGFFGIGRPSGHALAELFFTPRGLVTLTPICVLGAVGVGMLLRKDRREAILLGAIVSVFLAYNAGYTLNTAGPFGGDTPGPRFLIAMLPFLMVPLGLAARGMPGATASLLTGSIAAMALVTATTPMLGGGEEARWLRELRAGTFVDTFATPIVGARWTGILPFAVGVSMLLAVGLHDVLRHARGQAVHMAFGAATAAVAWLLVLEAGHLLYRDGSNVAAFIAYALAALMTMAIVVAARDAHSTRTHNETSSPTGPAGGAPETR
jgi:hypothetical protein